MDDRDGIAAAGERLPEQAIASPESAAPYRDEMREENEGRNEAAPEKAAQEKLYNEKSEDPEKIQPVGPPNYVEGEGEYDVRKEDHFGEVMVIHDAKELVTHVLHVDDDPEATPWTFRAFLIGELPAMLLFDACRLAVLTL